MHLRGKTKSCVFWGVDELPLQLVLPKYAVFHQFSILLRISKGSHRTMCFQESCNSNFLPGIAETTGVRWRGQGQGEKIYKLIVWICMNCLDVTWVLHCVAVRPLMWILETLNFQVCSRPVIHFVHCRHWRPLQTSSSGSWQRREKKNWVRFHWDCIHSIRWSLQSLLKLNSMKFKVVCSCNPSFSAGILLSRIGRVCFPCFFLGPEHIKGFGRTACGHSKQPSVQVLFRLTKNSTFWYLFRIRSFVQGQ